MTEEEVKLNYITPAIEKAGWAKSQIRMEYAITAGKIIVRGNFVKRRPIDFADYVLFYNDYTPLAVVEAKDDSHKVGDGMQQALEYADKLNVRFVFSSNGKNFVFHDLKEGTETLISLDNFPSPEELFSLKYKNEIQNSDTFGKILSTPYYYDENTFSSTILSA